MIVDDHSLVRLGIRKLLDGVSDIEVAAEADCGEKALILAKQTELDVVLLDMKMPGIDGLEVTRRLRKSQPKLKIIAVSAFANQPFPKRTLQAGAVGYLTKECGVDEMCTAIRRVYEGERYLSAEIAQSMALCSISSEAHANPFDALSERELQVTLLIAKGMTVQEISDSLFLSAKTVNGYRYRIFSKFNIKNDVELIYLAIKYRLIEKPQVVGETL